MKEVKCAIIGFGGIARAHAAGYRVLAEEGAPVRLVAVCDIDPQKFGGELKINVDTGKGTLPADCATYTSVEEMLANADFDMADICLPTYLHKEYAIKMLKAGKHVLSEKPMALNYADCCEMVETAKETGRRLMIGQCLRFNAAYSFLKACCEDGRYGKLYRLSMERLSPLPTWGFENWFQSTERSGGCLTDMHIHDVDMVRYLLGEPKAVSTMAWNGTVKWQTQNTRLFYDDCTVVIDGSWDEAPGIPFKATCRARFERAEVLLEGGKVTVYPVGGESFEASLPATNHMAEEIRYLAGLIMDEGAVNEKNPPESAAATIRLIEYLRESAEDGAKLITL
ncbi:MAG: Gfo/Idh/MocA family oxidoreductase [Clostridia bacterium]|nr:Gfo/Idh/MocA family oxidoreductase [Clostridia bacterium]